MAIRPEWVRLPSEWIRARNLTAMKWKSGGNGSDNTAALMTLVAIAHTADESGVAHATYDQLCAATGLSRAKLSNGLEVLNDLKVIERRTNGRSTYRLANYSIEKGWAKLPAKSMYAGGCIAAFGELELRRAVELNAMKLFFLFVAQRGRDTNFANIGYDKIQEYTGVERAKIKSAISLLASLSLIHVEHIHSKVNDHGTANAYRIVGVEPNVHMGTKGRSMGELDYES
jgi:RIO-like serine/threonine protein kinase